MFEKKKLFNAVSRHETVYLGWYIGEVVERVDYLTAYWMMRSNETKRDENLKPQFRRDVEMNGIVKVINNGRKREDVYDQL